jgi:GT2 family glycosyltransferase
MSPQVSVVIPTLNRETELVNTVDALLSCESKYLLEVIVVDQSNLPNARLTRHKDGRLIYLFEKIKNLPRARNIGIRRARGNIILFLDDDVEEIENIVDAHAEVHQRLNADVVTGPVLSKGNGMMPVDKLSSRDLLAMVEGRLFMPNLDAQHVPLFVLGCNMSYSQGIFSVVGLFDENFIGSAIGEDAEMTARVKRAGRRIIYDPSAGIIHLSVPAGGCRNEKDEHTRLEAAVFNAHYFHRKVAAQGSFLRPMYRIIRTEVLNRRLARSIGLRRAAARFYTLLMAWWRAHSRTRALLQTHPLELIERYEAGQ